jgi:hypothetical protein
MKSLNFVVVTLSRWLGLPLPDFSQLSPSSPVPLGKSSMPKPAGSETVSTISCDSDSVKLSNVGMHRMLVGSTVKFGVLSPHA